ncbi:helix-turn-helix domain-containing protein [Paraburkholderia acidiphila]|uniref:Helix-turn-helix domain-containing protein n=2 Tax=Paraburkholderia acidiphila TaxID=2571747 RepID=A0A7Z2JCK0_9BURK|nr:helix-turn-helix domain-containing protein [Paraburkholderia acidiphila]
MLDLFRRNVQVARLDAGMSQNALAKAAGLHRDYVWKLEKLGTNTTLDVAESLALRLEVDVATLFSLP